MAGLYLKMLLEKKIPDLTHIRLQDYNPSIADEGKNLYVVRAFFAKVEFLLRGWGVMRYEMWANNRKYRKYSAEILLKENKIFEKIFDVNNISKTVGYGRLYENIVKIKPVLDIIENKEYQKFVLR